MTSVPRRGLSKRQLEFVALGGTVGAGLFLGAGQGIQLAGPGMILAYAIAGLMVFTIARCLGEMALADETPSIFVRYTERYVGPRTAFVQAWSYWLCCVLVCLAELTAAAAFLQLWLPDLPLWVTEIIGLVLAFAINRLSVRFFGEIEFWVSLLKIATIAAFLLLGLAVLTGIGGLHLDTASVANLWRDGGFLPEGWNGLMTALPTALFAFGGTELIGIAAAESESPSRSVPRAINGLLFRLGLFYVGTTLVLLCLEPWNSVPTSTSPIVEFCLRIGIPAAGAFMNLVLVSAVLSATNSTFYASTRILKVLGEMRWAPTRLARLNRHGAPEGAAALIFVLVVAWILLGRLVPGSLFQLLLGTSAVVVIANWAIFLFAHMRFRQSRKDAATAFPVPGGYWASGTVLVLLAGAAAILCFTPVMRPAVLSAAGFLAALTLMAALRVKSGNPSRRADAPLAEESN